MAAVATSALALVPSAEELGVAFKCIQELRSTHDPAFKRWMPHINLIFPFIPYDEQPSVAQKKHGDMLASIAAAHSTLRLHFVDVDVFEHTSSASVILQVESQPPEALYALYSDVKAAFPACIGASARHHAFAPHLTLGKVHGQKRTDELVAKARHLLQLPFTWDCKAVTWLARAGNLPFSAVHTFPLLGTGERIETQPRVISHGVSHGKRDAEEETPNTSFYQTEENITRLCFSLPMAGQKQQGAGSSLFVVDVSGSMGQSLRQVHSAVKYMLKECGNDRNNVPAFIKYGSNASRVYLNPDSPHKVDGLLARGGMTNFGAAFDEIQEYILAQPHRQRISVVFMTDGHDTATKNLPEKKTMFRAFMNCCQRDVVVHAVGFTPNHDKQFLDSLRKMGNVEGTYRYAEKEGLDQRFEELFDFVSSSKTLTVMANGRQVAECPALITVNEDDGCAAWSVDVCIREKLDVADDKSITVTVKDFPQAIKLQPRDADARFHIAVVDEMNIESQEDLNRAQTRLSAVNCLKVNKSQRTAVLEASSAAQERLDKYHTLFSKIGRSTLEKGSIAAQLSSLRHEATFSKARRARAIAQRATRNASGMTKINAQLRALPRLSSDDRVELTAISDSFTCCLTSDSLMELMDASFKDMVVTGIRVRRPEHVVDAPTEIWVEEFCVGFYSFAAFQDASKYAIDAVGASSAHGGFTPSLTPTSSRAAFLKMQSEDVQGLFRGGDGRIVNACLPLYIHPAHFARVRAQLRPLLGYLFCLDPLAYKGDQMFGLYALLGRMLLAREKGTFASDAGDRIILEFSRVCAGIRPLALEYLQPAQDLLYEFVKSPAGRPKAKLGVASLLTLIGWHYALKTLMNMPEELAAQSVCSPTPQEILEYCEEKLPTGRDCGVSRFHLALIEEHWRRLLTRRQKTLGPDAMKNELEEIMAPATSMKRSDSTSGEAQYESLLDSTVGRNAKTDEKKFAFWAQYKLGFLGRKECNEMKRRGFEKGIPTEGLLSVDDVSAKAEEASGKLEVRHPLHDNRKALGTKVKALLASLIDMDPDRLAIQRYLEKYGGSKAGTEEMDDRVLIVVAIQAHRFAHNSKMNSAVVNGTYINTFDALRMGREEAELIIPILDQIFKEQSQDLTARVESVNQLICAKRIVICSNMLAFLGRLMSLCTTRGGNVFERVVGLLRVGELEGRRIPLLKEKIRAIMTGQINIDRKGNIGVADAPRDVFSGGNSWCTCPFAFVEDFRERVGEDEWSDIEISMHGISYWVYRDVYFVDVTKSKLTNVLFQERHTQPSWSL